MNPSRNIHIQFVCDSNDEVDLPRLENLIRSICAESELPEAQVQIRIVDDANMIEMNRRFFHKSFPTDVISFDLSDEFETGRNFQVVVNLQEARRQAKKRGHSTLSELALYITHGLLHQLGYDDAQPQQARRMHKKEDAILQSNGFGVTYYTQDKTES